MALTLVTAPTETFHAGFLPVEFTFKREDMAIVAVTSGVDGQAAIEIGTDLTTYLSAGDYVYLYAVGDSGNYEYDIAAAVVSVTSTVVTIAAPFIEEVSSGYINYKKNWAVEMKLVHPDNDDIKLLPFSLKDDGDNAGNARIDVSIVVDILSRVFTFSNREMSEGRLRFNVEYREISDGSTPTFTLRETPIIIFFATETPKANEVINDFDTPEIYEGYPTLFVVAKNKGTVSANVDLLYTELDINKISLGAGVSLGTQDDLLYGFLSWLWPATTALQTQCNYIQLDYLGIPAGGDFAAGDFDTPDFELT